MKILLFAFFILATLFINAQEKINFSGYSFEIPEGSGVENYKMQECINLGRGNASCDVEFMNGTIEFDICVQQIRGFAGVYFRIEGNNSEHFYIRMHQSGNPDAMQYTPVYNRNSGWQLYHGEGFSTAKEYRFDEWFHVKVAVLGTQGEVYIEDMDKPVLLIHELKKGLTKGGIAFNGQARFANVKISNEEPRLKGDFKEIVEAGSNAIKKYKVSQTFNQNLLIDKNWLEDQFVSGLSFTEAGTEADGLINLSKFSVLTRETNAVLAQFELEANDDMLKELELGFSDNAKVFVNGQAMWLGKDRYRSRDYRYLGTIGYFDSVYLPLKKGNNTITVMVSEAFGGWGLKARFKDLDGISIK